MEVEVNKSDYYKDIDHGDRAYHSIEPNFIFIPNAFPNPHTVMVKSFNADIAEIAMKSIRVLLYVRFTYSTVLLI